MPNSAARPVPAVVFFPPRGSTRSQQWMAAARQASAEDLIVRLREVGFEPISLVASETPEPALTAQVDRCIVLPGRTPFHFGRAFSDFVRAQGPGRLAYFGAASAPLATGENLASWLDQAQLLGDQGTLVNNLHSTDWAILGNPHLVTSLADRLPTDNPLGWVLREEAGLPVAMPAPATAARVDIDTPGDLALLQGHPDLGPQLRHATESLPAELRGRAEGLERVLRTGGASLSLIGRVSETAWREIVRRTQVWVRVYAEERGMRASGRLARGEVQSLIAEMVEARGPAAFATRLAELCQAAVWDTRVWMAHRRRWPNEADRMSADLGWPEEVIDPDLQAMTQAVVEASLPIVTGGQGVVAGSLRAFVETRWPLPAQG
ncbi:MAG TPA: hypothetical protein VK449_05105 [Anaerolineales bacterium]|nr:hypothetical protein [Anaerolineales bacterium]